MGTSSCLGEPSFEVVALLSPAKSAYDALFLTITWENEEPVGRVKVGRKLRVVYVGVVCVCSRVCCWTRVEERNRRVSIQRAEVSKSFLCNPCRPA